MSLESSYPENIKKMLVLPKKDWFSELYCPLWITRLFKIFFQPPKNRLSINYNLITYDQFGDRVCVPESLWGTLSQSISSIWTQIICTKIFQPSKRIPLVIWFAWPWLKGVPHVVDGPSEYNNVVHVQNAGERNGAVADACRDGRQPLPRRDAAFRCKLALNKFIIFCFPLAVFLTIFPKLNDLSVSRNPP